MKLACQSDRGSSPLAVWFPSLLSMNLPAGVTDIAEEKSLQWSDCHTERNTRISFPKVSPFGYLFINDARQQSRFGLVYHQRAELSWSRTLSLLYPFLLLPVLCKMEDVPCPHLSYLLSFCINITAPSFIWAPYFQNKCFISLCQILLWILLCCDALKKNNLPAVKTAGCRDRGPIPSDVAGLLPI